MRIIFNIILLISLSPALAWGAAISSLAILDLQPLEKVNTNESHQISEIIRSELIRSEFIRVIESSQTKGLLKEHQFQQTGLSSDAIIQLGKLLKADYLLTGSISRDKKTIVISVRVLSARTGENLHAVNLFTNEELFFRHVFDICDGVSSSILTASMGNTVKNIERMLHQENYVEAEKRLLMYERVFGEDTELTRLRGSVKEGLITYHIRLAEKYISERNPSKSYFHSRRALVMAPQKKESISIYKKTLKAYDRYREEEYRLTLTKARSQLNKEKHLPARQTLEQYYSSHGSGKIDEDFINLYNEIEKGLNDFRYSQAKHLSRLPFLINFHKIEENDLVHYSTRLGSARKKLLSSIESEPENNRNSRLLVKVNQNVDNVYEAYRETSDEKKIFATGKRNDWSMALSPLFTGTIGGNSSPVDLKGTLPGVRLEGSRFFSIDSPFSALASIGFDFNRGTRSENLDLASINTTFNLFSFNTSILFGYSWESLSLFAGPVARIGFIYRNAVESENNSEIASKGAGYIGAGIDMQANYFFSRKFFARTSLSFIPSIFFGMSSRTFVSFSVGLGYEF